MKKRSKKKQREPRRQVKIYWSKVKITESNLDRGKEVKTRQLRMARHNEKSGVRYETI